MRDNKKKIDEVLGNRSGGKKNSLSGNPLFRIFRICVLIYLGLAGVVWAMQRSYIYYPERADEDRLTTAAQELGLQAWVDSSGERIGWKKTGQEGEGALVVFHGNAGHALYRYPYTTFFTNLGQDGVAAVYLFEYPGYGSRAGSPSEAIFFRTAERAVQELLAEEKKPLYLLGESLGSGVACYLAGKLPNEIDGIILITPFDSLVSVGQAHFPFLPVSWLLRDRYENAKHLTNYHGPLAVIIAGRDEVVPSRLGKKLYEQYQGPKEIWIMENATHNTLLQSTGSELWAQVMSFVSSSLSDLE